MISAADGNRIKKRRQSIEVRLVVELQLPPWLQQLQGQQSFSVPVSVPVSIPASSQLTPPVMSAADARSAAPASVNQEERSAVPTQDSAGAAFVATSSEQLSPIIVSSSTSDSRAIVAEPSLVDLYEELLAKKERLKNEPKQVRDDLRYVAEFEAWLSNPESAPRITIPQGALVKTLEFSSVFESWARSLRARETGGSVGQTMKKMNALSKLAKACHQAGLISRAGKTPTQGELQMMVEVSDTEDSDSDDLQGEPVTVDEFRRMIAACRGDDVWPYLPKYWELKLTASYFAGFRLQDWFAELSTAKKGLLWSGVIEEPVCPRMPELSHESGWLWFLVHKTKKKDAKKRRNPRLLIPMPARIRELLQPYKGLHPERVFPVPCNKRSSAREFHAILKRAGLDDESRVKAGRPIIRLSEGKKHIASFRKGCSDMWADAVSEVASSYMLKHSVLDSQVSATTRDHYLRAYRPLKDIVPAVESLPIW